MLSCLFFVCVQLFDALIVIVSFVLDIVFRNREDAASGVGLLVILRLWRVARILNGGLSLFHPSSFVFVCSQYTPVFYPNFGLNL